MNKIKISYNSGTIYFASDKIISYVYEKTYMVIPYWVIRSDCHE
jgi:hypothetical protein